MNPRKTFFTLTLTLFLLNLQAQEPPLYDFYREEYSTFINTDTVELVMPAGADFTLVKRFFQRFERMQRERNSQMSIMHIGGSHVQAGVFSDKVREELWQYGNFKTARGFVFPYRVGRTNNPTSYAVSYRGEWQHERCVGRKGEVELGVGGFALYTSDPSAEITLRVDDGSSFSRIKVFGYVPDGADWAVMPTVRLEDKRLVYPDYDYVGKECYTINLTESQSEFRILFHQSDSVMHRFVLTGFLLENDEPGVVYHAIGVNGAAVYSYLACERFEAELAELKPDMVVFGIGINDAVAKDFSVEAFKANYQALVDRIRRVSEDCVFVFITNNDSYRRVGRRRKFAVNHNGLLVQRAMYELARDNNGLVFDQFEIMGGLRSMSEWSAAGLGKRDRIHFTTSGYTLIGDMFFHAFLELKEEIVGGKAE